MPVSSGRCSRRWVKASKPPADAPIPTTGKEGEYRLVVRCGSDSRAGLTGRARETVLFFMVAFVEDRCGAVFFLPICALGVPDVWIIAPYARKGNAKRRPEGRSQETE